MALFVNGEWFNPAQEEEYQPSAHKIFKKQYDALMKQMENFKDPIVLKVRRSSKKRTDSKGKPIDIPSDGFSYKRRILTKNGSETWVYQDSFPDKIDGQFRFQNLGKWVRGSFIIHHHEKDKLFFFMKKSGYLGNELVHYDPAAEAQAKADKEKLKGQLYFHIYNPESPLVSNQTKFKDVARSFGVKKVGDMSFAQIQNALFNKVIEGDDIKTRGVKAFLESISDTNTTTKQSQIQQAIEKGLIIFNTTERAWKFISEGEETSLICKVDQGISELNALLDYLKRSPAVENRILMGARTGRLSNLKIEDIESLNWDEIRRECEVAGIKVPGRKKEAIKDDLREWIKFRENVSR